jgi:hypothetical protein
MGVRSVGYKIGEMSGSHGTNMMMAVLLVVEPCRLLQVSEVLAASIIALMMADMKCF